MDAYIVAFHCVKQRLLRECKIPWSDCPDLPSVLGEECDRMVFLAEAFENQHPVLLKVIAQKLAWVSEAVSYADFSKVLRCLFNCHYDCWKKVICVYALGNFLAVHCLLDRKSGLIIDLAQWAAMFIENHFTSFHVLEDGWVKLCRLYT